jgi:hypothetical protein
MGAVATGDYIVGKGAIKGYGVAIHPEMTLKILNMQLEDHGMPIQIWGQISKYSRCS